LAFLILLANCTRRLQFAVYCTPLLAATPALPVPVVNGEPVTALKAPETHIFSDFY
jgi:hypothetical protein